MILNVSGRCDIVSFYTEWFMRRYHEGFLDVRNPFYPKLISRINFHDVDLIMFCTKNPLPIIDYIKEINKPILFHVTITPYKKDIEPNVINKKEVIEGVKRLSNILGMENVVVRYDPVFLSDKYNLAYHVKAFDKLCNELKGYITTIIVSFLDECQNVRRNRHILKYRTFQEKDYRIIGKMFSESAKKNRIVVQTCFEERNLCEYGFNKGECLSHELAFKLTGNLYKTWKARKGKLCQCVEMVDIGQYNACKHFCKYCYANYDEKKVLENMQKHHPESSLLIGEITSDDIIKKRTK